MLHTRPHYGFRASAHTARLLMQGRGLRVRFLLLSSSMRAKLLT
jgi:hypothetical protein